LEFLKVSLGEVPFQELPFYLITHITHINLQPISQILIHFQSYFLFIILNTILIPNLLNILNLFFNYFFHTLIISEFLMRPRASLLSKAFII
jgi:hypothetical protein